MWDFLGKNEWGLQQFNLSFPSVKWAARDTWWGIFEGGGLLNVQGLMELTFPFVRERQPSFLWEVVYLLTQFLLQSFQEPYSRNSVYLLEHKGLFYDIFRYYASYRGYHGDEENQSSQHKVQILHVNNSVSHRLRSRMPNLENRWLFMDSVVGFGILCGFLGELLNCINSALRSEPCGQKSIVGYRNVRYSSRPETICFTEQRNLSLWLMWFHVKSTTYKSRLIHGMIVNNAYPVAGEHTTTGLSALKGL